MALKQHLIQKLEQRLSPQQIQLMKLLQVPTMELDQRIKQEIEENPALEDEAFPVKVRDLIERKLHREAVEAVAAKNGISLADPDRLAPVVVEFESLSERKNPVAARRIVLEAAQAGDPAARHLLILLALRDNDAPRAWNELQAYLRVREMHPR